LPFQFREGMTTKPNFYNARRLRLDECRQASVEGVTSHAEPAMQSRSLECPIKEPAPGTKIQQRLKWRIANGVLLIKFGAQHASFG